MTPVSLRLRLRRAIERAGMTQEEWCEDVGLAPSALSRILTGERTPTLRQATLIEAATGIPAGGWLRGAA